MDLLSHLQAGSLGEQLALAKLNTLGFAAYSSPEGARGHDLMVVVNGMAKSVEVKTRQFGDNSKRVTKWNVNMSTKSDADFFLFVELELSSLTPTFYFLSNEQAKAIHKVDRQGTGSISIKDVRASVSPNDFSPIELEAGR